MDGLMLNCDSAELLIASAALEMPLERADATALREHLSGCSSCRLAARDYTEVAQRLPLALDPVTPPAALRARIMAAAVGSAPTRAVAQSQPSVARRLAGWLRPRLAPMGMVGAVAVASFLLARVTTHQTTTSAVAQTIAVSGTTSEPDAHGSLVYEPASRQIVMSVSGLPEPTAVPGKQNAQYEVWLVRADRSVNGVAFLTRQPDGSWTAAWHGDLTQYSAVAATVEPSGGSSAPTSAQVLQAQISTT